MVAFEKINLFSAFDKLLQALGNTAVPWVYIAVITMIKIEKISKDNDNIGIFAAVSYKTQGESGSVNTGTGDMDIGKNNDLHGASRRIGQIIVKGIHPVAHLNTRVPAKLRQIKD